MNKALNAVVAEDMQSIITSKFCEEEQGHDKELKSENFIPVELYLKLMEGVEQKYGEELQVQAVQEIKEAQQAANPPEEQETED